MMTDVRFALKLMRRRARLFTRQIVLAAVLTAVAIGFLASSMSRSPAFGPQQRISTAAP